MPFLELPNGFVMGQSTAIANYIGNLAGMEGATPQDVGISQMCMAEGEDIYSLMQKYKLQKWQKPEDKLPQADVDKFFAVVFCLVSSLLESVLTHPQALLSEFSSSFRRSFQFMWRILRSYAVPEASPLLE